MTRKIEFRTLNKRNETNADEIDGKKIVAGVIPYNVKSQRMALQYSDCEYEMLLPSVFKKTLADNADVYCNYAHDDLSILGNTKSGTLQLDNREDGLHFTIELDPDNEIAMRAYSTIKRQDCNTLSFEFYPYDWYEEDGVCMLRSAKLIAISLCVINPAYQEADAETISDRGLNEMQKITRAIENKELDLSNPDTLNEVKKLLNQIQKALQGEEPKEEVREDEKKEEVADDKAQDEAKSEEPKVETPEQSNDTQTGETKSDEDEADDDLEKQKQLEKIQKELEKELSESL